MIKKSRLLIFLLIFLNFMILVTAHQPRIVFDFNNSIGNPIMVEKPEISKAYYGELKGAPDYYKIESSNDFNLYLNILSPDLMNSRTDFFVEVISNKQVIFSLDGNNSQWKNFYEGFGGDYYLMGPELETKLEAGTYYIKVSNKDNIGKYSLAIGKLESFPLGEIIKTTLILPRLKEDFFNKSPFTAFFNYTGLFLLIILILICLLIILIVYIIKKLNS